MKWDRRIYIAAIVILIMTGLPGINYAGDIEAQLPSNDGSDAFRIQDSDLKSLMNVWSNGSVAIGSWSSEGVFYVYGSIAGTGTIISSSTSVTGSGTAFKTELTVGDTITADPGSAYTETRTVTAIASDNGLTINSAFSSDIVGSITMFSIGRKVVFESSNVGIGTWSPSGILDVEGGDVFIGTGTLTNTSASEDLSVTGNLEVDGIIYGDGSGLTGVTATGQDWSSITNIPPGFLDGYDDGILTESDPVFTAWDKSKDITITESQINDLNHFTNADVSITETQITDLNHFTTADETDPEVGINTTNYVSKWNGSSLVAGSIYDDGNVGIGTSTASSKLDVNGDIRINAASGGQLFFADGSSMSSANTGSASSISNAADAIITGDSDADSAGKVLLKTGSNTRLTILNSGLVGIGTGLPTTALEVVGTATATAFVGDGSGLTGYNEADPVFTAWDKSEYILITESQITDLNHFTNNDETDQVFTAWDKSEGVSIKEAQISDLNHFTNADVSITESQISNLTHFTTANEIDPVFGASAALGIEGTDITNWNTAFGWDNHSTAGYSTGAHTVDTDTHGTDSWADGTGMVTTTNYVGIGTPSPNYKLEVRGGVSNYLGSFYNENNSSGNTYGIYGSGNAYGTGTDSGFGGVFEGRGGSASGVAYGTHNTASAYGSSNAYGVWSDATAGSTTGREYAFYGTGDGYFSGDVGIGTTTPNYKLEVRGGVSNYLGFFYNENNSSGNTYGIYGSGNAYGTGTDSGFGGVFEGGGGSASGVAYGTHNTASAYGSSNAYGVWSDATAGSTTGREYAFYGTGDGYFSGNVGIGTPNPATRLDLNGALSVQGIAAPALSPAGQGRVYYNSTENKLKVSENGGAYVDLLGGIASETDPVYSGDPASGIAALDITNWTTAFDWGDHSGAGYLTTETDPVFIGAPAFGITAQNITDWGLAFGWEDHSTAGYSTGAHTVDTDTHGTDSWTDGTGKVTTTNYVGIGTTGPGALLNIYGNGTFPQLIISDSISGTDLKHRYINSVAGNLTFGKTDDNFMSIEHMRIDTDGKVGIGAIIPSQQLEITKSLELPDTTDSTTGVIYKGANRFMHNFKGAGTDGSNLFVGRNAGNFTMGGSFSTDGSNNTGIGEGALFSNTTGFGNTANGASALYSNTIGHYNTANGRYALYSNDTGSSNTANGDNALYSNTIGSNNTANGADALYYNDTGNYNTANGTFALTLNDTGSSNTANGYLALSINTTGSGNTALGYRAGDNITTGSNNIIIGYDIDAPSDTDSYQMSIGNLIYATGVNGTGTNISSGNVGIGTNTPTEALTLRSVGTTTKMDISPNTWMVDTSIAEYQFFAGTQGYIRKTYDDPLVINSNDNIILDTTGNVGIGTPNPGTKLDLNGALSVQGVAAPALSPAGQGRIYYNSAENKLKVSENGGAYVDLLGGIASETDPVFSAWSETDPVYGASAASGISLLDIDYWNTASGWGNHSTAGYSTGAHTVDTDTHGTDSWTDGTGMVTTTNYVGIGTINPAATLQVHGTGIRITDSADSLKDNSIYARPGDSLTLRYSTVGSHEFIVDNDNIGTGDAFAVYANSVNGTPMFSVRGNSGNVGIGTMSPGVALQVEKDAGNGSGGQRIAAFINTNSGNDDSPFISVGRGTAFDDGLNLAYLEADNAAFLGVHGDLAPNGLVVADGGKVGIGTTDPTAKLHIYDTNGKVQIDSGNYFNGQLRLKNIYSSGSFDETSIGFIGKQNRFWVMGAGVATGAISDKFGISYGEGDPDISGTNSAFFTIENTGNVGIGTTGPAEKLHVIGRGAFDVPNATTDSTGVSTSYGLSVSNATDSSLTIRSLGSGVMHIATDFAGREIRLGGGLFEQAMTIKAGGNIGIGTTEPGTKLDLNGALSVQGVAAPALSPAGQGRVYYNSAENKLKVSENGGAYVDLLGGIANETDPVFSAWSEIDPEFGGSAAFGISLTDIGNWNTAFGWGNHAAIGYLTDYTEIDPTITDPSIKDGVSWDELSGIPAGFYDKIDNTDSFWSQNVSDIYYNSGKVGIGTTIPNFKLEVIGGENNPLGHFFNDNNTSGEGAYGISVTSDAYGTGTGEGMGGYFNGIGGSTDGSAYGTQNYATTYGSSNAYGVWSNASANGSSNAYGVYSNATVGTTTGREYAFYGEGDGYFSGKVGIGTAIPSSKFEVMGGVDAYIASFSNYNNANGEGAFGINVASDAYNTGTGQAEGGTFWGIGGSTGGVATGVNGIASAYGSSDAIGVMGDATQSLTTGRRYAFYGLGDGYFSGKVGIGTLNPGSLLHISGDSAVGMVLQNPAFPSGSQAVGIVHSGLESSLLIGRMDDAGSAMTRSDLMIQSTTGNVGIGTTAPSYQLHIVDDTSYDNKPAIYGEHAATDYYGVGVRGVGLNTGVQGFVNAFGAGTYFGVRGEATTTSSTGVTYGVHGTAIGGANSYAGYFVGNGYFSGNVGIGTDIPNYKLDVRGNIGNNTTLYHSDIRWKKGVSTLKGALEKVTDLRGVNFEWRADEFPEMVFSQGVKIGFIAQEVEEILPELVSTGKDGFKSVQYANIVPLLVEAVKELKAENETFKKDNVVIKTENSQLREKLAALADRQQALEDMFLALSTSPKEKLAQLDD